MKSQFLYVELAANSVAQSLIELLSLRRMESHSLLEKTSDTAEAIQGDGLIELIDGLNSAA
jgi:hypothetical protein